MSKLTELTGKLGKFKYPVLVLLLGLLLMLLPGRSGQDETPEPTQEAETLSLAVEEARLSDLLSKIQGAGKVEVMLSLRTGQRTEYQTDTQLQTETGGAEELRRQEDSTVLYGAGSGSQQALVRHVEAPQYLGALVVCQGADDPTVRLDLVQAVSSVTGLGADQITVVKMR